MKIKILTALAICSCLLCNEIQAQTAGTSNTLGATGITGIQSTTATGYKLSAGGAVKIFGAGAVNTVGSPTLFLVNNTGRKYGFLSNNSGHLQLYDSVTALTNFIVNGSLGRIGIGSFGSAVSPTLPDSVLHVIGGFKLVNGTQGINKVLVSDAAGGASWQVESGDVTSTSTSGSLINTIGLNKITYAKMQAMTANRLLGSGLSGTAVSEIILGTGLSFTGNTLNAATGGSGTVTNFSSGNLSPLFTTVVATSSATPALSFLLNTQTANTIFAGPNGSTGAPTFRSLVAADIPNLDMAKITTGNLAWSRLTGTPTTLAGYGITDAAALTHNHTLDGLSNVLTTGKVVNDQLKWNGTNWVSFTPAAGGASQWTTSGSNIYYNTGNVGIGTTTPAYKLDVAGAGNFTGNVTHPNGTSATPSITFTANTNTGLMYASGNGPQMFAMGNSAGAGFAIQNNNASGYSGVEYYNHLGNNVAFTGFNNNNNQEFRINNFMAGGYLNYMIGGVTKMQIANNGNVGIGTITPTALLHVNGNGLFSGNITSPGAGLGSEKFGYGANIGANNYSLALGYGAASSGHESVAIGSNATASLHSVAIGTTTQATGFASTLVGHNIVDAGTNYKTAIGASIINPGYFSGGSYLNSGMINIGYNNISTGYNYTQLIGANLTADRNGQMLIGNGLAGGFLTDIVLGGGLSNSLAATYGPLTIRTTDGNSTNAAGMSLAFKGGKSTGNANGGQILFYTTASGAVGSTLNTEQERMRIAPDGNIGIGTTNISDANYKLFVETGIRTRKVKVDITAWPDYVFQKNYQLPSLKYLEAFIRNNNHLPDVASATEVEKNGIDLGDNQAILLRKVEELTLYIIEQDKKIEKLQGEKEQLQNLQKQIDELKTLIQKKQ